MKYGELFNFEPLESVKELRAADDTDKAREDVRTFVISDRLADQLKGLVIPHLRFDQPAEGGNKGLLVVANYGTGKTHLMAVISAVAEHADLAALLTNKGVAEAAGPIAGKFRVIRAEIGYTKITSLRDIVVIELEKGLERLGVKFKFAESSTNSKDDITEMMAAFEQRYPDQGLLLVLDELLDYLRQLKDTELIQAFSFLREVGEIHRSTRFRFISGVQEALFDNPRFAHVADAVRRVKDRYEQIRISREDVAFVVRERLLRKTVVQRDRIRDHLAPFGPLFEGFTERLEDFIALFPVHPAYLRTFELLTVVEKRTVLKTLSQEMKRLVDQEVPTDSPGLLCSDSYRAQLSADPSFRAIPDVRDVLDRSEKLRGKIEQGLADKQYIPVALRIVDGLAVHRLTTEDVHQPIGMTVENLRDELCLLPPGLPRRDARFLATTIKSIIGKVMLAVSGQYLTEHSENGQIYLDIDKDIDYDANIEERAKSLDDERLDDGYFKALEEVLERRDEPYVSGYRIWEYEIEWADHNVTRIGYLFMGAPNERSTAQPPRDYYIYFLQPYAPPRFDDEQKADEVFFRLERPDEEFTGALRRYAGAFALERESTGRHRDVYADKRKTSSRKMVDWLRANMGTALTVTHRGERKALGDWLGAAGSKGTVKDQMDAIAARALAAHFEERYPGYPKFTAPVTKTNLAENVRQALQQIAQDRGTILGSRMLESFGLVDTHGHLTTKGPYAKALAGKVKAAAPKVVNRSELLGERDPGLETWAPWHLEPAWLVVVAAVLVQAGQAEISYPGFRIDALSLSRLASMGLNDLQAFSHVAPPRELPILQLRRVAVLLSLPEGVVPESGLTDDVVREFFTKAVDLHNRVVKAREAVRDGSQLWGTVLFDRAEERDLELEALQKILEDVRARDTVGKMTRLELASERLEAGTDGAAALLHVEGILAAKAKLDTVSQYLRQAADVFGPDPGLSQEAEQLRAQIIGAVRDAPTVDAQVIGRLRAEGDRLRKRFADEAARAYRHHNLDADGDRRKKALLQGAEFDRLRRLTAVSLLPGGSFARLQSELAELKTLMEIDETALQVSVILPSAPSQPKPVTGPSAAARLEDLERRVKQLHGDWARTLLENLQVAEMAEQVKLLPARDRKRVEAFVKAGALPDDLDDPFVQALDTAFRRFVVKGIGPDDVWKALFPEASPATTAELRERFAAFAESLEQGIDVQRLRLVPNPGEGLRT